MGCDIHTILQKKEKGKWVDKEVLDIDRNYDLFGILADVRNNSGLKPIKEPRGLPADFEIVNKYYHPTNLKLCFYDDQLGYFIGEHTYSWLTLKEVQHYPWERVIKKLCYNPGEFFGELFMRCRNLNRWRIVFGFDS
jgi:hypothetical protein